MCEIIGNQRWIKEIPFRMGDIACDEGNREGFKVLNNGWELVIIEVLFR